MVNKQYKIENSKTLLIVTIYHSENSSNGRGFGNESILKTNTETFVIRKSLISHIAECESMLSIVTSSLQLKRIPIDKTDINVKYNDYLDLCKKLM